MNDSNGIFVDENAPTHHDPAQLPNPIYGLVTNNGVVTNVVGNFTPIVADGSTTGAFGQVSDIPQTTDENLSVVCSRELASDFIAVKVEEAPAPGALDGITLTHESSFDSTYNVGHHELVTGTDSEDGSPSLEGSSNLDGLLGVVSTISQSGGTFEASDWDSGGAEIVQTTSASDLWPVTAGGHTEITYLSNSGGPYDYRWELQDTPTYFNLTVLDPVGYSTLEDLFANETAPTHIGIAPKRLVLVSTNDPEETVGRVSSSFSRAVSSTNTGTLIASDQIPVLAFSVTYPQQ